MTTRSIISTLILAGVLACCTLTSPNPALAVNDDQVLRRMDAVLEENARLREESWKLHKSQDREAARHTAEALAASEDRLERTRTEALAHVAGVSPAQVEALRKDGKSWGQTSGELGVHPGFLGIGKAPLYESRTARKAKPPKAAATVEKPGKKQAEVLKPAGKPKKSAAAAAKAKKQAKPKTATKTKAKSKKQPT